MGKIKEMMFDIAYDVINNYLDIQSIDAMDDDTKEDAIYGVLEQYIAEKMKTEPIKAEFARENIIGLISFIITLVNEPS